jgi:hypothetical protein
VGRVQVTARQTPNQTDKSFLVLFFKKEQRDFFLKKEAKAFYY